MVNYISEYFFDFHANNSYNINKDYFMKGNPMFNIFKRRFFKRNTLTDKEIFNIEYDSYEFLKTVVNKIKPYII